MGYSWYIPVFIENRIVGFLCQLIGGKMKHWLNVSLVFTVHEKKGFPLGFL